jgi:type I restriction enzyme S subunit
VSWPIAQLGDVAKIERDSIAPSDIPSGSRYVGLEHIESGGGTLSYGEVANGELASSKFRFGSNHILFGKLRPYLAKIVCPEFTGICSTDILPIAPAAAVEKRYLLHFLRRPETVAWASSRATGVNLPRLSPSELETLEVPLPPLEVQRRIAAILDKASALYSKRRQSLNLLDTFVQSVFANAFKGSADAIPIGKLLEDGSLSVHKDGNHGSNYPRASDFAEEGVPFLSAQSITDEGTIDVSQVQYLREVKAKQLRIGWIVAGDVLLAHNASVGKVALHEGQFAKALIGTSLTCFRPNIERLMPQYLASALRSRNFQTQLEKSMGQTTRNQVPITAQRDLTICIPSLERQREYCEIVSSQTRYSNFLRQGLAHFESLFCSLQNRAFSGQL